MYMAKSHERSGIAEPQLAAAPLPPVLPVKLREHLGEPRQHPLRPEGDLVTQDHHYLVVVLLRYLESLSQLLQPKHMILEFSNLNHPHDLPETVLLPRRGSPHWSS